MLSRNETRKRTNSSQPNEVPKKSRHGSHWSRALTGCKTVFTAVSSVQYMNDILREMTAILWKLFILEKT